jgi:hypothetical protein
MGAKLWTSGYYISTVGVHGNEHQISNYVKNQGKQYQLISRNDLSLFDTLELATPHACIGVADCQSSYYQKGVFYQRLIFISHFSSSLAWATTLSPHRF